MEIMAKLSGVGCALVAVSAASVLVAAPADASSAYDSCNTTFYDGRVWLDYNRFGNLITVREFTFAIGYRDVIGSRNRVRVRIYVKVPGAVRQVLDWSTASALPGTRRVDLTDQTYANAEIQVRADFTFHDPVRADPSCTAISPWR
jgi:hypothetical protein